MKLYLALSVALVLTLLGCQQISKLPDERLMTQVEIRSMQTRDFPHETSVDGMKAVVAGLQDESFTINQVNETIGLITASKQINDEDTEYKDWQIFWQGQASNYRAVRQIDVNINVQNIAENMRIRISAVAKELNESGGTMKTVPIQDPQFYQNLFSKIDKSVFLTKNQI